jgi:hypothetical protein
VTTSPLNALAARLESIEALDGPARTAGRTVRRLIRDGAPEDLLSGAWLGHALHPLMSDVPIGTWTSSVLLDWTGGNDSRSAADRLILAGVLAAGATVGRAPELHAWRRGHGSRASGRDADDGGRRVRLSVGAVAESVPAAACRGAARSSRTAGTAQRAWGGRNP